MTGCHIEQKINLETGKWVKTHPKQWGQMCWALLCTIQVPFQVQFQVQVQDFERCRHTMDKFSLFGTSYCLFCFFFNPKNTHFWTNLDLEWHLDGA